MIQRIQTVWLALAALCIGSLFLFHRHTVAVIPVNEMGPDHSSAVTFLNFWGAMGLGALAAVLAVLTIFLFKNRPMQIRLTRLALFDTLLMMIVAGVQFYIESARTTTREIQIGWAVALPFLAVVFLWLALRGIRKDEKLVKSMDRLR